MSHPAQWVEAVDPAASVERGEREGLAEGWGSGWGSVRVSQSAAEGVEEVLGVAAVEELEEEGMEKTPGMSLRRPQNILEGQNPCTRQH